MLIAAAMRASATEGRAASGVAERRIGRRLLSHAHACFMCARLKIATQSRWLVCRIRWMTKRLTLNRSLRMIPDTMVRIEQRWPRARRRQRLGAILEWRAGSVLAHRARVGGGWHLWRDGRACWTADERDRNPHGHWRGCAGDRRDGWSVRGFASPRFGRRLVWRSRLPSRDFFARCCSTFRQRIRRRMSLRRSSSAPRLRWRVGFRRGVRRASIPKTLRTE
jgi:hypothetical protein